MAPWGFRSVAILRFSIGLVPVVSGLSALAAFAVCLIDKWNNNGASSLLVTLLELW
jgi:hypothetical protein